MRGVDNAVDWLLDKGYRNVLIEVNNECNVRYDHAILQAGPRPRADRARQGARRATAGGCWSARATAAARCRRRTSSARPTSCCCTATASSDPARIAEMVRQTRKVPGYRPMPILFNEDDHFDFDKPANNFAGRGRRVRLVGLLRLPHEGRRLRRRLPERAGELEDQQPPQAGVLRDGEGDDGEPINKKRPV